jgi:hypothetical protein
MVWATTQANTRTHEQARGRGRCARRITPRGIVAAMSRAKKEAEFQRLSQLLQHVDGVDSWVARLQALTGDEGPMAP